MILDTNKDVVELTQAICDVYSVSGSETELADAIEATLRTCSHLEVIRSGDAIVAKTNLGRAKRVVIAGHIDTVPVADNLPTELRNRVARLEIEGEASAGAVVLVDERWRRRPVGLVSGGPIERQQPLLGDVYYLQRALAPFSEVRVGSAQELLQRELAVLVLADTGRLAAADQTSVEEWLKKGGMVLRFAGARLSEGGDDFIPVPLRGGGRTFGGAMSWGQPVSLQAFDPSGPFAGLVIADDVKVMRQVLAEPSLDLASKTWARLSDGTPLITFDRRGDGWLVLVHTMATPEWSTLPISGLFVEMLQRLVGLSQGVTGEASDAILPPLSSLDEIGRAHV